MKERQENCRQESQIRGEMKEKRRRRSTGEKAMPILLFLTPNMFTPDTPIYIYLMIIISCCLSPTTPSFFLSSSLLILFRVRMLSSAFCLSSFLHTPLVLRRRLPLSSFLLYSFSFSCFPHFAAWLFSSIGYCQAQQTFFSFSFH